MGASADYVKTELEATEAEARANLEAAGVDIAALIAEAEAYDAQLVVHNATLVDALDGQDVEIPGYALPLEYSGTEISEFLLVPYVGACIHVPPPPPNQIVYVRFADGIREQRSVHAGPGRGPHLGGPLEPVSLLRGRQRRHRRRLQPRCHAPLRSTTARTQSRIVMPSARERLIGAPGRQEAREAASGDDCDERNRLAAARRFDREV